MTKKRKKSKNIYIVVPARVQDMSEVHRLQNDCFPEATKSLRWLMERLSDESKHYVCYVAKIAGTDTVVGFTLAKLTEKGTAEIIGIGVSVMYRRQGIGRLLLAHFLDEASDSVTDVIAYVPDNSDYLSAQLFLRDCGFPDSRIDRKKGAIKFQRILA